ncbi:uncharacterized protein LOC111467728 [Cucurbita maxima]|uniref:Uncharacterized protein LOC111467728 n=2 Tax=Cucurbita TaxID=3660 RepID=A0A6J1HY94_CUCMA|nr:uncharacterized protein LOC111467728 [Cucurbita maxima]
MYNFTEVDTLYGDFHRRAVRRVVILLPLHLVNGHGRLRFDFYSYTQNSKLKKKMLISLSIQGLLDLFVAGISLVIGLGIFALIATILCSAAFLHSTKDVS